MTTLSNNFLLLKSFSLAAAQEEQNIESSTLKGIGLVVGSPEASAYLKAPRPRGAELETFVDELPDSHAQAFVALMYAGRDNESNVLDTWNDLKGSFQDNADVRRTLLEKSPRIEYIEAGIERACAGRSLDELHASFVIT